MNCRGKKGNWIPPKKFKLLIIMKNNMKIITLTEKIKTMRHGMSIRSHVFVIHCL